MSPARAEALVDRLVAALDSAAVSDPSLQVLLAAAVRAYARRVQEAAPESTVPAPFPEPPGVTPTEVVLTVRQMLATLGIAPFELAIVPW
ncbi:MAG TPA: hypothetical protein VKY90_01725 [Candidatus Dormibacteraeota bacterium]|nr:hypothetical protein [Candidatus Dormibacteraeota bacterium]